MKYYLVCFGQTVSPGVSLDGTLPAGAVVCTQAQYENYQSWAISNGALVAATPPTLTLAQQAATPQAPPPPAVTDSVTLNASAATWVQVRRPGGPVLYDHVLQPGETWQSPQGQSGLELTVGNAGGLTLSAGGVTTQPLGRNGEVRRNIPLNPAAVADGSVLVSQPVPAAQPATGTTPAGTTVTGSGNYQSSPLPSHVDPE